MGWLPGLLMRLLTLGQAFCNLLQHNDAVRYRYIDLAYAADSFRGILSVGIWAVGRACAFYTVYTGLLYILIPLLHD